MEKSTLQDLVDKRLSIRQIAKQINKSESSVKHWLKKYSLKTNFISLKVKNNDYLCNKCLKEHDPKEFYSNNGTRHTYCKKCINDSVIERQKINKEKSVEYKGGSCEICGYNKYIGALQFHHKDPKEKDPDWKKMKNRKFDEKTKAELDKCMLLCANCHFEIHNQIFLSSKALR